MAGYVIANATKLLNAAILKYKMHRRARLVSGIAFGKGIRATNEQEYVRWTRLENRAFRIGFEYSNPFRPTRTIQTIKTSKDGCCMAGHLIDTKTFRKGLESQTVCGQTILETSSIIGLLDEIDRLRAHLCSCPSGDGSLRWPCKAHPPEKTP